jgi:hypothetical protein
MTTLGQTVPEGFEVEILAEGLNTPKGIISPLFRSGVGAFEQELYVAESGADQVLVVDKDGAGAIVFAPTNDFPVGVAFGGGSFGRYLYVGNAFSGGIQRVDMQGNVTPFALPGQSIAGLDFGRGLYGQDLYAGEWTTGAIWRVDPAGQAVLFSDNPGTQTRYLKFSHGGSFGTYIYYTDILFGDIYRVDPTGIAELFASVGSPCLEGLDFSAGDAFGHHLYVGDICTGDIFQVGPDGSVELWGYGFENAADIHFQPSKQGGFTMYVASGIDKVYAVHAD